ncbi:MAG: alkaline phosphatase family protein [Candidatus Acidiferrales bacterium]
MPIEHVFVLMLENRSFDHMLGFSGLKGTDAVTGKPTKINGVPPGASNTWKGANYPAIAPAVDPMVSDPRHEFEDVLEQLCGNGAIYPKGGPYPPINNSGFASNFSQNFTGFLDPAHIADVMRGFPLPGPATPAPNVRNLYTLAQEFAVCDSWFASMPGPTFPNRCFALGASSAGLDHSPNNAVLAFWDITKGFCFQHGSIFDAINNAPPAKGLSWRVYAGNKLLVLARAFSGTHNDDIFPFSMFPGDVANPVYGPQFTWIEPSYGNPLNSYLGGSSQHPLDGVIGGEALIKATYEAIRSSPVWDSSMLIITWDEHGGYYDHFPPPSAPPPGDTPQAMLVNKYGFAFNQYGPRVPAVVVSPLIPANTIDHRHYDHSSIPKAVEQLFGLSPLTARDRAALDPSKLATLSEPRTDTPESLEAGAEEEAAFAAIPLDNLHVKLDKVADPTQAVDFHPNLPIFLYVAARTESELPPAPGIALEAHVDSARARVRAVTTRAQALAYLEDIRSRTAANLDLLERG